MIIFLGFALGISIAANVFSFFKIKKLTKDPKLTTDASDLLHDLTKRGRAVIDMKVIDPENLFVVRRGR